jgi:formylglycine-generating enzyme required for sulfatase activity
MIRLALFLTGVLVGTVLSGRTGRTAPASGSRAESAPEIAPGTAHTNVTDGSVLVWIPGGEFEMGSLDGDADERPVTRVRVKGFWLGKFEVTNEQFARFLEACGGSLSSWRDDRHSLSNQPATGIRWQTAQAYCKWAGLRLPTEAEWEYAARGGRQFKYPTATGALSPALANFFDPQQTNRWDGPSPVGSFPPNPFGIHDLAGNAWEWTSSLYRPYPFDPEAERTNGSDDRRGLRVMRGGCWRYSADFCRAAHRHRFQGHLTYDFAGLRVALSPERPRPVRSSEE